MRWIPAFKGGTHDGCSLIQHVAQPVWIHFFAFCIVAKRPQSATSVLGICSSYYCTNMSFGSGILDKFPHSLNKCMEYHCLLSLGLDE